MEVSDITGAGHS